jgi:hypothetical protein
LIISSYCFLSKSIFISHSCCICAWDTCFSMPGFMYERRCLILPLPDPDSSFELVQTMLSVIELDSSLIPRHSRVLLIGIDFLLYPFMLLFHLFQFLHVIPRQLSINVGKIPWSKSFTLLRTIIPGMLFLAQRLLKLLVVSGFTRSNFVLMGLWIDIKHD